MAADEQDIDSLLEEGIRRAEKREQDELKHGVTSTMSMSSRHGRNSSPDDSLDNKKEETNHDQHHDQRSKSKSKSKSKSTRRRRGGERENEHRSSYSRERRRRSSSRRRDHDRYHPHHRRRERRSSSRRNRDRDRSYSPSRSRSRSRRRRSRQRSRRSRRRRKSFSSSSSSGSSSSVSSSAKNDKQQPTEDTELDRAEKARKKELMELTRDHRTVFVGQLVLKADEKKITKFFKKFGPVSSVLLLRDKFTNRSKGIAYVEMTNLDDVPKVLLMNGQVPDFQVFPVMIKTSEAEKNFVAKKESEVQQSLHYVDRTTSAVDDLASRIQFRNLHEKISEEDLRTVFQSFGEVMSVQITRNEAGESNGQGFIQFDSEKDAKFALSKADGLELAGKYLKLSRVDTNNSLAESVDDAPSTSYHNNYDSWKLDDDENIGVQMTSHSRSALMAKLARGSDVLPSTTLPALRSSTQTPITTTTVSMDYLPEKSDAPPVEGSKSFCFVMKNMFDPATETGMDWHTEIKEDVEAECSKYGRILHSYVDKDKAGGLVYILFDNTSSAVRAVHQMHGRWFNKKQVTVRYLSSQEYVGMFPEARSAVQEVAAQ